jgi:vacuolar-type H+-ATPase subunit H
MVNLDATYAELQARLVEPFTKMSPLDIDEARKGFKNVYDKAKEECDKILQLKLNEIEEGYQRYLNEYNDQYDESDADNSEMEISHDSEIEALFN